MRLTAFALLGVTSFGCSSDGADTSEDDASLGGATTSTGSTSSANPSNQPEATPSGPAASSTGSPSSSSPPAMPMGSEPVDPAGGGAPNLPEPGSQSDAGPEDDVGFDDLIGDDPVDPTDDAVQDEAAADDEASDDEAEPAPMVDGGAEVPMTDHCAQVADWDPEWLAWEEEVLFLVNEARATGYNCDTEGEFGPADPLTMNGLLTCSARLHSLDMYERGYFAHESPDGTDPGARIDATGYLWSTYGENIAQGYTSPQAVVEGWLDSDGHCSNIMNENFTELGVGYYPGDTESGGFGGDRHYWTQNFGAPREEGGFGGGNMGGFFGN